jgi:alkaline phosphatase
MADFMGFNLEKLSQSLFTNAKNQFEKQGYTTRVYLSNPNNPVFIAKKAGTNIEIPANKNIIIVNGETHVINGVAVFNGKDFFVSKQALQFLP